MNNHERALAKAANAFHEGLGRNFEAACQAYHAERLRLELESEEALALVAELQANGWQYGTHPRDKAGIVLAALLSHYRKGV